MLYGLITSNLYLVHGSCNTTIIINNQADLGNAVPTERGEAAPPSLEIRNATRTLNFKSDAPLYNIVFLPQLSQIDSLAIHEAPNLTDFVTGDVSEIINLRLMLVGPGGDRPPIGSQPTAEILSSVTSTSTIESDVGLSLPNLETVFKLSFNGSTGYVYGSLHRLTSVGDILLTDGAIIDFQQQILVGGSLILGVLETFAQQKVLKTCLKYKAPDIYKSFTMI
ncbi:hypothetical protein CHU98_g10358, partial [Xylaria longipes]